MRSGILWLLPDAFLPLLLPAVAIGLIIGVATGRTVMTVIGLLIFLPIIGGMAEGIFGAMPPWLGGDSRHCRTFDSTGSLGAVHRTAGRGHDDGQSGRGCR